MTGYQLPPSKDHWLWLALGNHLLAMRFKIINYKLTLLQWPVGNDCIQPSGVEKPNWSRYPEYPSQCQYVKHTWGTWHKIKHRRHPPIREKNPSSMGSQTDKNSSNLAGIGGYVHLSYINVVKVYSSLLNFLCPRWKDDACDPLKRIFHIYINV